MANRPLKLCAMAGCNKLINGAERYCINHIVNEKQIKNGRKDNPDRRGYGTVWRKLRPFILKRDNYICVKCGHPGNQVDHIKPKIEGGDNSFDNLQTLCEKCHIAKTNKENGNRAIKPRKQSRVSHYEKD